MKRSFLALLMILIATTTAEAATTKKKARKHSKKAPVVQTIEAESRHRCGRARFGRCRYIESYTKLALDRLLSDKRQAMMAGP
jgi:hypothetical protein